MPPLRRNNRSNQRGARQRAPSTWSRIVSNVIVTVPAASKVIITTLILNNPGIGETIRRTRGRMFVWSDQTADLEEQFGAMGAIVVSDVAAGVGAGSVPGPFTEAADDGWYLWVPIVQRHIDTTIAPALGFVYEFDSKAMRKVEEGYQSVFVVENGSATFGLKVALGVSSLSSIS